MRAIPYPCFLHDFEGTLIDGNDQTAAMVGCRRKNVSCIIVEDSGAFMLDSKGNAVRMLGVLADITEKRSGKTRSKKGASNSKK